MKTSGNTILITGGSTGIGFALAEAFMKEGNKVIACARSESTLNDANKKLPGLITRRCDLSREEDRESLHRWVTDNHKDINILVNNAGIQRMIDFKNGPADLLKYRALDGEDEIDINFRACVYLTALFVPDLLKRKEAAVMNVSSGLGFVPLAMMPVYCATKAAVHSFTVSLRHQLRNTPVKVFEIIPPMVDTNLDKGAREAREQRDRGIPPAEVARATLKSVSDNEYEIAVGNAQNLVKGARANPEQLFSNMNR
jgi:uncharacterized oxidoreductase